MKIKGHKSGYKDRIGVKDRPISVTADDEMIGIIEHLTILRFIATNELIVNRRKIMKYIDNENCFFFRSAVIDIFEGWRTWIQSESDDPLDIWEYTLEEVANRYLFSYRAKKKAQKMDSKIEEIFKNDRVGTIDTDNLVDDK